jgi:hypothetical protein
VILDHKVHLGRQVSEVLPEARATRVIQVQLVHLGSKVSEVHWEPVVLLEIPGSPEQLVELDGLDHQVRLDLLETMGILVRWDLRDRWDPRDHKELLGRLALWEALEAQVTLRAFSSFFEASQQLCCEQAGPQL